MGSVLSIFRKEPPSLEQQLETVDKKIFQIHEFNESTEHAMKKIIGAMVFYGVLLIMVGGVFSYFYFDHSSYQASLICLAPLILAPFVLWGSKRFLQFIYTSRIERKKEELNSLIKEKKGLINKVKETETYKKAQELLEKYDPDTRMRKAQAEQQRVMSAVLQQQSGETFDVETQQMKNGTVPTPNGFTQQHQSVSVPSAITLTSQPHRNPPACIGSTNNICTTAMDVRRRTVGTPLGGVALQQQQRLAVRNGPPGSAGSQGQFTPLRHNQLMQRQMSGPQMNSMMATPASNSYVQQTARPILPQDRGTMEKVIDYIVGEGPNNRYALICRRCAGHNGMALKEEFEYLAFKCCYCLHFNPARKLRPTAPPPTLSAANSMTSLNDISRSGSPVPSNPSVKDSDQDGETGGCGSGIAVTSEDGEDSSDTRNSTASSTSGSSLLVASAGGDSVGTPKGDRPAPEGDETQELACPDGQIQEAHDLQVATPLIAEDS